MEFFHQNPYSKCSGCEVHGGFTSTWESVRGPVMDEVERLVGQQPNAKVFVTGHSLGAAVAVLAAADLGASAHSLGYPIEGVYTYGQPRVGNKAFREFYETGEHVSFRLTHWKDIVPHLPPKGMDDYYHTSTEVFYTEDSSQYTICDGSGEDPKCSDQFMLPDSLEDHRTYLNLNITYCTGP